MTAAVRKANQMVTKKLRANRNTRVGLGSCAHAALLAAGGGAEELVVVVLEVLAAAASLGADEPDPLDESVSFLAAAL